MIPLILLRFCDNQLPRIKSVFIFPPFVFFFCVSPNFFFIFCRIFLRSWKRGTSWGGIGSVEHSAIFWQWKYFGSVRHLKKILARYAISFRKDLYEHQITALTSSIVFGYGPLNIIFCFPLTYRLAQSLPFNQTIIEAVFDRFFPSNAGFNAFFPVANAIP